MAKGQRIKKKKKKGRPKKVTTALSIPKSKSLRPSNQIDTRVVYCGDCLDHLKKLPDACIDLIYIDPPFNSNQDYEVFWGETKEKRAFVDRHASTRAYIDFMHPRCMELACISRPPYGEYNKPI